MYRKFASISSPEKYAFAFDENVWDRGAQTNAAFRAFETYGDGLTQHSGDWPVGHAILADYLHSLAAAMLADSDLTASVAHKFTETLSLDGQRFAATLIAKATDLAQYHPKKRYWSLELRKVSSNKDKQHDKRFAEFAEWMTGSPASVRRILTDERATVWSAYCVAENVFDSPIDFKEERLQLPALALGWTQCFDTAQEIHEGYEFCRRIAQAHKLRQTAESDVEGYKAFIERSRAKRLAEQSTAA